MNGNDRSVGTVMMLREMQWLILILFVFCHCCAHLPDEISGAIARASSFVNVSCQKNVNLKQWNDRIYTLSLAQIPHRNHFNGNGKHSCKNDELWPIYGNWKWMVPSALSSMGSYGDLLPKTEHLSPISILSLFFVVHTLLRELWENFGDTLTESHSPRTNSANNQILTYFVYLFIRLTGYTKQSSSTILRIIYADCRCTRLHRGCPCCCALTAQLHIYCGRISCN